MSSKTKRLTYSDLKRMMLRHTHLLQGPIADALIHVGQLALLRRLADAPLVPENYLKAPIVIGTFEY